MSDIIDWNKFSNQVATPRSVDMSRWNTKKQYIHPDTPLKFEHRVLFPSKYPTLDNGDGSVSTHKMAYAGINNGFIAYPPIVMEDNKLKELSPDEAFKYATKNKEYRLFNSEEEAADYAEGGYKSSWGMGEQ